MRGEKRPKREFCAVQKGSPPHARGKADAKRQEVPPTGITPACAGKSKLIASTSAESWDHPRMRGEKLPSVYHHFVIPGSPPHARGKAMQSSMKSCRLGITPACAGKSQRRHWIYSPNWDHPRMRGEKASIPRTWREVQGSPPHARGKAFSVDPRSQKQRITPACAGKSFIRRQTRTWFWDHPRMRGEKSPVIIAWRTVLGSPPHARGKVVQNHQERLEGRITPACAGKRVAFPSRLHRTKDHPRMRGEKIRLISFGAEGLGSPPHARGKAGFKPVCRPAGGITPACAGKSSKLRSRNSLEQDHPRMRGEKIR